jgi:hypothetical protein
MPAVAPVTPCLGLPAFRSAAVRGSLMHRCQEGDGGVGADRLAIQSWKATAKEPVLAASASSASTVVELTEQQRGAMAATHVQEVFRKRGLVLG